MTARQEAFVVETPEQVGIDIEIAGVGSRFLAALIDVMAMGLLLLLAALLPLLFQRSASEAGGRVLDNVGEGRGALEGVDALTVTIYALGMFAVFFGYYIVSELVTDGRSLGKRSQGLRVLREDGSPVGPGAIAIRNLVRVIDVFPGFYGVGLFAIALSRKTQRLGDLAAGTIVVKDRLVQKVGAMPEIKAPAPAAALGGGLPPEERALIERFFERAGSLDAVARRRVAAQIAARLHARRAPGAPADDEAFLHSLIAARDAHHEGTP